MTTIQLTDDQARVLEAKAAAHGVSLEAWVQKLASNDTTPAATGTIDWSQCPAVESVPGKMSGAWVLKGTRMPVATIFENLEAGANIDNILEWFAGLDRNQVEAVIAFAVRTLDRPPTHGL